MIYSKEYAEHIKYLVKKASEIDSERKVFGASSHKYLLNPVVTIEKVRELEKSYNVTLPEEYVFYLTMIGNGGAGPYYGIYPIEKVLREKANGAEEVFIDDTLTKEKWKKEMQRAEESDDAYDDVLNKLSNGVLNIGTQGCTYDNLLMYKGSEKGKIIVIDWNLEEDYPPININMSFLEWYEKFFIEIVEGHNITAYGYYPLLSEEELITSYMNSKDDDERKDYLLSFYRFKNVSMESLKFLCEITELEMDKYRLPLLFKFNEKKAIPIFEELLRGKNKEAAISSAKNLPEGKKEYYYCEMIKKLYDDSLSDKVLESLLFFINSCNNKKAEDIISFARNKINSIETRRTAIYVIGDCNDKTNYLDNFIEWMTGEEYYIAHSALQAIAKVKDSKLVGIYNKLKIKYKNDSMMMSNINIAINNNIQ